MWNRAASGLPSLQLRRQLIPCKTAEAFLASCAEPLGHNAIDRQAPSLGAEELSPGFHSQSQAPAFHVRTSAELSLLANKFIHQLEGKGNIYAICHMPACMSLPRHIFEVLNRFLASHDFYPSCRLAWGPAVPAPSSTVSFSEIC